MNTDKISRILIGGTGSGSGKTTVTCAVLKALKNRGKHLVSFKCGPDYIDPMFHSRVLDIKARNLDLFLCSSETCRYLLAQNSQDADLAVLEGVMGFYDGTAGGLSASTYHLAKETKTPGILVLDCKGKSLSIVAEVMGFLTFQLDCRIRGVILNRISPALYPQLKAELEKRCSSRIQVLGYLPDNPDWSIESRHLGLITPEEQQKLEEKIALLGEQAEKTIELDRMLAIAEEAPPLEWEPLSWITPIIPRGRPAPVVGVSRDKAFCFYYEDNLALLESLGARLRYFSPLKDTALPEMDFLYLGGGYPELYAKELSENTAMLEEIRLSLGNGMPCLAECGGYLYLHKTLEDAEGQPWEMVGYLPGDGQKTSRLQRFGYANLTAQADNLLCDAGEILPAHEFHYWKSNCEENAFTAQKPQRETTWSSNVQMKNFLAGFAHFHFYSSPEIGKRIIRAALAYQKKRSVFL